MAYAFIQQVEASTGNVGSLTLAAPSISPTAGNLLVFAATNGNANDTITLDDGAVGNVFVEISSAHLYDSTNTQGTRFFYALNCKGGATVITATYQSSVSYRCIYVAEYSGIAKSGAFLNASSQQQIGPGTGTDAITSTNANATSQPALVWGFTNNYGDAGTTAAGTGFTSRTAVWNYGGGGPLGSRPEDKRVTSTGNVAATFTAATGTDLFHTIVGIFAEPSASFLPILGQITT